MCARARGLGAGPGACVLGAVFSRPERRRRRRRRLSGGRWRLGVARGSSDSEVPRVPLPLRPETGVSPGLWPPSSQPSPAERTPERGQVRPLSPPPGDPGASGPGGPQTPGPGFGTSIAPVLGSPRLARRWGVGGVWLSSSSSLPCFGGMEEEEEGWLPWQPALGMGGPPGNGGDPWGWRGHPGHGGTPWEWRGHPGHGGTPCEWGPPGDGGHPGNGGTP